MRASRLFILLALVAVPTAASAQKQSSSSSPTVSPDGKHILFSSDRDGADALYIMNVDGTGVRRIANRGGAVWAADGAHIYTTAIKADTVRVTEVSLDGDTAPRDVGSVHVPGAKSVTVSNDGKGVLIGAGDWTTMQLYYARIGLAAPVRITPGTDAFWCSKFSADGRNIATTRSGATHQLQVWVMETDGSHARAVTHFAKSEGGAQCATWSPDGGRLAIQSAVPSPSDTTRYIGNVWIVDVASGRATKLALHAEPYQDELPSWFPDGKRIAFQSNRTGAFQVWVMNVDGTGARQVTR